MTTLCRSRDRANETAERIKRYAQPQRLMILSCLLAGERTVGEIEVATGVGQPALSQQLAELRRADLVSTRRAAKQIYYKLSNDDVTLCVRAVELIFGGKERDLAPALAAVLAPNRSAPVSRDGGASARFAKVI